MCCSSTPWAAACSNRPRLFPSCLRWPDSSCAKTCCSHRFRPGGAATTRRGSLSSITWSNWSIKPSFPRPEAVPIYGARLSQLERNELRARIRHQPQDYVAQELVSGSTAPAWNGGQLRPTYVAVRTFAFAADGNYEVMPGGLARVSESPDALGESALGGQGSKDVWVLSEGPVSAVTLLHPAGSPVGLQRSGNDLPSRVADHLFWLGRHAERTEGAARLVRSIIARLTSETAFTSPQSIKVLLRTLAEQGRVRPEFVVHVGGQQVAQLESELLAFVFDASREGSLAAMLTALHRAAAVVRDRISIDSWRILNGLALELRPADLARRRSSAARRALAAQPADSRPLGF